MGCGEFEVEALCEVEGLVGEDFPGVGFDFEVGGVREGGDGGEGFFKFVSCGLEGADAVCVDGDMIVDACEGGVLELSGGVEEIGGEVGRVDDLSIGELGEGLVKVARVDVIVEGGGVWSAGGNVRGLDGTADLNLVDTDVGGGELVERPLGVFKLDGLMANIVA